MKVRVRLEFELANNNVTIQHVKLYATETHTIITFFLLSNNLAREIVWNKNKEISFNETWTHIPYLRSLSFVDNDFINSV